MTKSTIKFTKENLQRLKASSKPKWHYAENFEGLALYAGKQKKTYYAHWSKPFTDKSTGKIKFIGKRKRIGGFHIPLDEIKEKVRKNLDEWKKTAAAADGGCTIGGSAGRGGGPIQATLRSQPPSSVNGEIRITDQGEVIQQKYGYEPLAKYNLCSYIGAVMEATLNPPPQPKDKWRKLIEKMSEISTSSYRKSINESSDFIRYFKTVTPHVALGKLSIGSRPSKRKNIDNIKSLRAIPWVFAWTQIRLMLPAWLGSAEAPRYSLIKKFKATLIDMEKNWPFFNSTIDILDMVISKVDPEISKVYENNLADEKLKRVGKKLRFQFESVKKLNKTITPKEIIKARKQFRTSIIVRNIYSEVLNILQAVVMGKLSNKKIQKIQKKYLEDAMMTSIAGISAAMKNTG